MKGSPPRKRNSTITKRVSTSKIDTYASKFIEKVSTSIGDRVTSIVVENEEEDHANQIYLLKSNIFPKTLRLGITLKLVPYSNQKHSTRVSP